MGRGGGRTVREGGRKGNEETRGRETTYKECIYDLKETVWSVLFLASRKKKHIWDIEKHFLFYLFC